jgi:hypothetical protein
MLKTGEGQLDASLTLFIRLLPKMELPGLSLATPILSFQRKMGASQTLRCKNFNRNRATAVHKPKASIVVAFFHLFLGKVRVPINVRE